MNAQALITYLFNQSQKDQESFSTLGLFSQEIDQVKAAQLTLILRGGLKVSVENNRVHLDARPSETLQGFCSQVVTQLESFRHSGLKQPTHLSLTCEQAFEWDDPLALLRSCFPSEQAESAALGQLKSAEWRFRYLFTHQERAYENWINVKTGQSEGQDELKKFVLIEHTMGSRVTAQESEPLIYAFFHGLPELIQSRNAQLLGPCWTKLSQGDL